MSALASPLPVRLARLVRLEHTVFALPFAYVGALLSVDGWPGIGPLAWVDGRDGRRPHARDGAEPPRRRGDRRAGTRAPRCGSFRPARSRACRSARSASLALARLPRRGARSSSRSSAGCGRSPSCMFVVYPYLKRVTWLCHLWLGACLGLAPVGAWVAITGELPWQAWALGGAVCLWVAGFDLFYALFDLDHDRASGLHSWATRFGVHGTFRGARAMHAGSVALLAAAGAGLDVGAWYWLGVAVVAALLALRAPDRAARRPATARRRVLHGQRRPLDHVLRLRRARHAALSLRSTPAVCGGARVCRGGRARVPVETRSSRPPHFRHDPGTHASQSCR